MSEKSLKMVQFSLAGLLCIHIVLALACFLTMDADLGHGVLRSSLDRCIDAYESAGFGQMGVGVAIVTFLLVGLNWACVRMNRSFHARKDAEGR